MNQQQAKVGMSVKVVDVESPWFGYVGEVRDAREFYFMVRFQSDLGHHDRYMNVSQVEPVERGAQSAPRARVEGWVNDGDWTVEVVDDKGAQFCPSQKFTGEAAAQRYAAERRAEGLGTTVYAPRANEVR